MSIWFDRALLPATPHVPPEGTLSHHLGIRITAFQDDALEGTLPVDGRTRQVMGLLHGGASLALAETLMSAGAGWTVDRNRFQVVGLDINANHLRGVRDGVVTGRAAPVHRGRSTQVWTCEIRDAQGHLVCTSRMTVSVLERRT
ncbi:MAG TPA: hotdog fold thioesterase [Ramlibacter sp.]|nr:hotdog fold thioesterase [Ramlibacter sp.]